MCKKILPVLLGFSLLSMPVQALSFGGSTNLKAVLRLASIAGAACSFWKGIKIVDRETEELYPSGNVKMYKTSTGVDINWKYLLLGLGSTVLFFILSKYKK